MFAFARARAPSQRAAPAGVAPLGVGGRVGGWRVLPRRGWRWSAS